MTQRFDRDESGGRVHVLSPAALAHLDQRQAGLHSYDQYLATVKQLGLDLSSLEQAYRRMVFNVVAVNRDDHTKNFAFMRTRDGEWGLAPAFDLTHAYRPNSEWTSRHNLRVNAKTEMITLEDLYIVGNRQEVPGYKAIVREVIDAVDAWPVFAATAEVDQSALDAVTADLERFRPR
jgi:serine/threonine-protein kinase HipA